MLTFLSQDEATRANFPWPDVYFTPQYGGAVAASDRAVWEMALWEPGPIAFPYLRRSIEPDLGDGRALFDIVSPYGYAGTWAPDHVQPAEWTAFRMHLCDALVARGCVAEFHRFTALLPGRERLVEISPELEMIHHGPTVAIDLSAGYDAYWSSVEGRCRTKVRKAKRLGYSTMCRPATPDDVAPNAPFRLLYEETMQRADAPAYYHFGDDYFASLQRGLRERLLLVEARSPDGKEAVMGLALEWTPFLHLHLVGSTQGALRDGAGNMLYDALAAWGCEQARFKVMHIGGGMRAGDAIYNFKKSFGGRDLPFWTGRAVIDPVAYERLVTRRATDAGRSVAELVNSGYFPAYRAGA